MDANSAPYQVMANWIRAGAPRTPADAPTIIRVTVEPANATLAPKQTLPLKAIAEYSDGRRRDVTDGAAFHSNDRLVAKVSDEGIVEADRCRGKRPSWRVTSITSPSAI